MKQDADDYQRAALKQMCDKSTSHACMNIMKSCFKKTLTYSSHTKTYKNAARTVVRESVRSPELSAGQTWLSTDRQNGRLLYMSTSPERSYVQSTTRQLSKITNAQPSAIQTATHSDECAITANQSVSKLLKRVRLQILEMP